MELIVLIVHPTLHENKNLFLMIIMKNTQYTVYVIVDFLQTVSL